MNLKGVNELDFVNYKDICMFIAMPYCTFKCEKECGIKCCQNSPLYKQPTIFIDEKVLCDKYVHNPISKSIVFGGMEPLDSFEEILSFINILRVDYNCNDTIIIYTGYNKNEILDKINKLSQYKNITVKFGRYVPNMPSRFDEILGVQLASNNQYAEVIS